MHRRCQKQTVSRLKNSTNSLQSHLRGNDHKHWVSSHDVHTTSLNRWKRIEYAQKSFTLQVQNRSYQFLQRIQKIILRSSWKKQKIIRISRTSLNPINQIRSSTCSKSKSISQLTRSHDVVEKEKVKRCLLLRPLEIIHSYQVVSRCQQHLLLRTHSITSSTWTPRKISRSFHRTKRKIKWYSW